METTKHAIFIPQDQAGGYCSTLEELVLCRVVYQMLDEAERETLDAKMLLSHIERLDAEIKEIEASFPRWHDIKPQSHD